MPARVDAAQLAPSATPNGWNPSHIAGTETPSCVSSEHKGRDASAVQHNVRLRAAERERVHDVQDPASRLAGAQLVFLVPEDVGRGSQGTSSEVQQGS